MATHDLSEEQPDTHRMGRRGSVLLVLVIAVALTAAVTALTLTGHERAEPYIMVLLAAVGAIGVFALLAMATGILRVRSMRPTKALPSPTRRAALSMPIRPTVPWSKLPTSPTSRQSSARSAMTLRALKRSIACSRARARGASYRKMFVLHRRPARPRAGSG
jgi:hypothetical protein